ncbi:hypothetical protein FRB97_005872 [Tulasnella sp. 331]|nr:hypothetical protein FRB97_005872 [Tulasnella sp. 331]KAG8879117.1 hypothetical protein FRB98_005864 [Tulasnella sp. 332]
MDSSSSSPAAIPESEARFRFSGASGEDIEAFLQEAAENRTQAETLHNKQGVDIWLQPYFDAQLAEPARGWFKNLDENIRSNWDSASEALRVRYGYWPLPATAPNAPRAAIRPLSREATAVEEIGGAAEYLPPPVPMRRPQSSWVWMLMVKLSLLAISKLTKRYGWRDVCFSGL